MIITCVRDCPVCSEFLKTHSGLDVKNIRNQKMRKNGTWFHTSWRGRALHKYVIKKLREHSSPAAQLRIDNA